MNEMRNTTIISSVSEFVGLLNLTPDSPGKTPVYRGEPKLYELPCEPKAFRAESTYRKAQPSHMLDPISMKVGQWKRHVVRAEGRPLNTESQIEDMILAQHYGVATRLLDWSTNPLVALWFAVTYKKDDAGFVYVFDTSGEYLTMTGETYSPAEDKSDRYNALHKNPFNLDKNIGPGAQYLQYKELHFFKPAYLPDARVLAQSGVISIHPRPDSFKLANLTNTYKVQTDAKHNIKRELDTLGINFRTLGLATRESVAQIVNGSDIIF